jgi:hypothetical protein
MDEMHRLGQVFAALRIKENTFEHFPQVLASVFDLGSKFSLGFNNFYSIALHTGMNTAVKEHLKRTQVRVETCCANKV